MKTLVVCEPISSFTFTIIGTNSIMTICEDFPSSWNISADTIFIANLWSHDTFVNIVNTAKRSFTRIIFIGILYWYIVRNIDIGYINILQLYISYNNIFYIPDLFIRIMFPSSWTITIKCTDCITTRWALLTNGL